MQGVPLQIAGKNPLKGMNFKSTFARSGVYMFFLALVIFFALSNPNFLTINNFWLIIQQAAPLGIAVVGMVFVMVVSGIDISVGSSMYFTAVVIIMTIKHDIIPLALIEHGVGYIPVYLLAIIIGAAIGLINGFFVYELKMQPFIVTLSIGSILRGLGYIICNSQVQHIPQLSSFSNSRILFNIPTVFVLFAIIAVFFDMLLRRNPFGKHILAIGNSVKSAQIAGIRIGQKTIVCYIICGILTAVSGVLQAGQIGSVPLRFADGNEFIVISAAVLGGTSLFGGKGTIVPGAVIGIFLITVILNGLAMVNASPYVYTIVRAAIIFLAVMLDSINYKGDLR
jgi:ribose/xylose/arabinose/galactoside ABC-type transport system permease subunit